MEKPGGETACPRVKGQSQRVRSGHHQQRCRKEILQMHHPPPHAPATRAQRQARGQITGKCKRQQAKHLEKTQESHYGDLPCSDTATIPPGGNHGFPSKSSAASKACAKIQPLSLKSRPPATSPFSYSFNKHWINPQTDILQYHWHLTRRPQKRSGCF